jgi:mono/diheme cytochrome c family protein
MGPRADSRGEYQDGYPQKNLGIVIMRFSALVLMCSLTVTVNGQTPVTGPSWLEQAHRNMEESSMGRSSRQLGPTPSQSASPIQIGPLAPEVTLSGADIYRLKCQACHGPTGDGAPPEINSIIDPVRATSAVLVLKRMRKTGAVTSSKEAAALAGQAETSLLDRLRKGGKFMPDPGLGEDEIRVLVPYLKRLAGLPTSQKSLQEPTIRVGEHLMKSTCHICHAAVGPNPTPAQLGAGAIPPLSTLTSRAGMEQFVRKVTHGSSVALGELSLPSRGRMPVFDYISEDEAAAGYVYLLAYPPQSERTNLNSHPSTLSKH